MTMINSIPSTLQPYALYAIPHPADNWTRWLAAWRGQSEPDRPRCPECDDELVRRKGKFGSFYGCASYPICTFTRSAPSPPIPPAPTSCPLCLTGRVVTKTSKRGNKYKQCSACEAFIGSRFITAAEKPRVAADKAAEVEKKRIAKAKKAITAEKLQREMVVQLPVEGWTPAEWFGEGWNG